MVTLLHLIVVILIDLFSLVRILNILSYFLHISRDESLGKDVLKLTCYYNSMISQSLLKNPTCLEAAFMLNFFMNRQNIPTEFCLGITKSEGRLTAHAWLTFRGGILGKQFQVDEFIQVFSSSNIGSIEVCRKF